MEVPGGDLCPYCRSDLRAHNAAEAEAFISGLKVILILVGIWLIWSLVCAIFNGILWLFGAILGVILGHWILTSVIVIAAVVFSVQASNAAVTNDAAKSTAPIDDLA
jgi:uncharacterized membrane protein